MRWPVRAWLAATELTLVRCQARGFGTQDERDGAVTRASSPDNCMAVCGLNQPIQPTCEGLHDLASGTHDSKGVAFCV